MHWAKTSLFKIALLLIFSAGAFGCGGNGNQYTLDATGTILISNAVNGAQKFGAGGGEPQVLIGTVIVQVRDDFFDGLVVDVVDMDIQMEEPDPEIGQVRLQVTPQVASTGTLYKNDDQGIPFGSSFLDIDTQVVIPEVNSAPIDQFLLQFQSQTDPNQLPVLGTIPTINFLFQSQDKQAEISELIILVTPELADALDD